MRDHPLWVPLEDEFLQPSAAQRTLARGRFRPRMTALFGQLAGLLISLVTRHVSAEIPQCAQGADTFFCARALSAAGRRAEAIRLLEAELAKSPSDSDLQNLHAAMLSWDGRYAEARAGYRSVLARRPGNYDAVRGLLRVELWDDRPAEALALVNAALAREPRDAELQVFRARALRALGRRYEAKEQLDEVLAVEPHNEEAASLRSSIDVEGRRWSAGIGYAFDTFSDGRADWHEGTLQGKRINDWGSVIVRYNHAWRFSSEDDQVEVEAFPGLWRGAYADVAVAVAPREVLYPLYRGALDIYQGLGRGFEASAGYRHLKFTSTVHIIVLSLGKYWGDWYFVTRAFLTPDEAGVSQSYHVAARYYFLGGDFYAGVRYGHGLAREEGVRSEEDITVLNSNTGATELGGLFADRLDVSLRASYSYGRQPDGDYLGQLATSAFLSFRF